MRYVPVLEGQGASLTHSALRKPPIVTRTIAIACLAVAAFIAGPPPAIADDNGGIRLVTQNMYVGTSFAPLTAAQTPQQLLAAVATIYNNILATKPAERAAAMAREIARHRPDLVALQEASVLRTGNGGPATTVRSESAAIAAR